MAKAKEKESKAKEEVKAEAQDEAQDEAQAEAEEKEPRKPSNELKIVIVLKDDAALVGLQSPDCDPIFTPVKGGLPEVQNKLPALVKSAKAKWDANPKNPKANLPEPPPPPEPVRRQATTTPKEKAQPSFF